MNLLPPEVIAEMPAKDLAEWLIGQGEAARRAALQSDADFIRRLRDLLKASAGIAEGERLRLLEVAESFVRALGRTELSPREMALRTFVAQFRSDAEWVLSELLKPALISRQTLETRSPALPGALQKLVDSQICEWIEPVSSWALLPSARGLVLDLVEPMAFRLWRVVEEARARAADLGMNQRAASEFFAGWLGVEEDQARLYLSRFPVGSLGETAARKPQSQRFIYVARTYTGVEQTAKFFEEEVEQVPNVGAAKPVLSNRAELMDNLPLLSGTSASA